MEYHFPVKLPRFSDDEMKEKKATYVSENGYYISPPGLGDIIHIRFHDEPDDEEFERYKTARRLYYLIKKYPTSKGVPKWKKELEDTVTPSRYSEISDLMQNKRERYKRSLASPAPTWLTNIGSVMTFFDDVNDTAGTAAVICRIAARFAPRFLSRFLLGPAGWLLLIADIFGTMLALSRAPLTCIGGKRAFEGLSEINPFSKRSRARRSRKLKRVFPGKGEMIELLQTTDNIFGIGLCLGPIVGFAQDIIAGTVRTIMGQDVHWHSPPPETASHEMKALRTLRFAQAVGLAKDEFTEDEHWLMYVALNGATQVLKPYFEEWDPFDQVEGLENVLFGAPVPNRPTTIEILREFGQDPDQCVGWPGLDKTHATALELWDFYQKPSAERFYNFCERNRHNQLGSTGAQNAFEFGKNMLLITEGYETVDEEFGEGWKGWHDWYSNGCQMADCWSVGIGGCAEAKGHVIFFNDYWWYIAGCSQERLPLPKTFIDRCIKTQCDHCEIVITPDMCPAGYQEWVVSVAVYKYKGIKPPPDWP